MRSQVAAEMTTFSLITCESSKDNEAKDRRDGREGEIESGRKVEKREKERERRNRERLREEIKCVCVCVFGRERERDHNRER